MFVLIIIEIRRLATPRAGSHAIVLWCVSPTSCQFHDAINCVCFVWRCGDTSPTCGGQANVPKDIRVLIPGPVGVFP